MGKDTQAQDISTLQTKLDTVAKREQETLKLLDLGVNFETVAPRLLAMQTEKNSIANEIAEAKAKQATNLELPTSLKYLATFLGGIIDNQEIRKQVSMIIPSIVDTGAPTLVADSITYRPPARPFKRSVTDWFRASSITRNGCVMAEPSTARKKHDAGPALVQVNGVGGRECRPSHPDAQDRPRRARSGFAQPGEAAACAARRFCGYAVEAGDELVLLPRTHQGPSRAPAPSLAPHELQWLALTGKTACLLDDSACFAS